MNRRRRRARSGRGRSDGLGRTERAARAAGVIAGWGPEPERIVAVWGGACVVAVRGGRASLPDGVGQGVAGGHQDRGSAAGEVRSERVKCVVCAAVWGAGRADAQLRPFSSAGPGLADEN
jgi:hypothetical protein